MNIVMRSIGFVKRILSGEDVVLIHQTTNHWNKQFENGVWDRLTHDQPNTMLLTELVLAHAKEKGLISVLDVGCGNGGLARLLAPHSNVSYCGIDISANAVATAQSFHPTARFWVGNAEEPPADLGVFDIVVFNEVLYYFNAAEAIARYRPHVRHGALVLISVVRFWRSPFVWRRIHHIVGSMERHTLRDHNHVWDVASAVYP